VKVVALLQQYEKSVIENQVLHLELVNTREQTLGKENELRQLLQKCSDAKVINLLIVRNLMVQLGVCQLIKDFVMFGTILLLPSSFPYYVGCLTTKPLHVHVS
jgi:hypothetical protein